MKERWHYTVYKDIKMLIWTDDLYNITRFEKKMGSLEQHNELKTVAQRLTFINFVVISLLGQLVSRNLLKFHQL